MRRQESIQMLCKVKEHTMDDKNSRERGSDSETGKKRENDGEKRAERNN